jgi:hypothetical protein
LSILKESFSSKNPDRYTQYISSPEWREQRKKRLKIDDNKCQICESQTELEIHHKHYRNFGHEDVEKDLITLCRPCHEAVTASIRFRRMMWQGVQMESTRFEDEERIIECTKTSIELSPTTFENGREVSTKEKLTVKLIPTKFG